MEKKVFDHRLPRLWIEGELTENGRVPLEDGQVHYLKNVLRRPDGSQLRVFNGQQGEFLASLEITHKTSGFLFLISKLKDQPVRKRNIHLAFALIKKDRLDWLMEKSVELGVTQLTPLLTDKTTLRDFNLDRAFKQVIEAAEQCERLDIPLLNPPVKLARFLETRTENLPLYAALEREDVPLFNPSAQDCIYLTGPEGGFSEDEKDLLSRSENVKAVSLGEEILRAETAAFYGLSLIKAAS